MLLKSDLDIKQTHLRGQFVEQKIAPALGVTKLKNVRGMIWVIFVVLLKSDINVQQTYVKTKTKT